MQAFIVGIYLDTTRVNSNGGKRQKQEETQRTMYLTKGIKISQYYYDIIENRKNNGTEVTNGEPRRLRVCPSNL